MTPPDPENAPPESQATVVPVASAGGSTSSSTDANPCSIRPPGAEAERVRFVDVGVGEQPNFAEEVVAGLGQPAGERCLPYRFLYDARGSELFDRITELEEYYPTKAELDILSRHGDEFACACGADRPVVELGSGSATKAKLLLPPFCALSENPLHYVPIDISRAALEANATVLTEILPGLRITALVGEYQAGLERLDDVADRPRVVCWLGGSVGNMQRDRAAEFFGFIRPQLGPQGCALVGVDLRKDKAVLERAYDDSLGVTAQFNLNLLHRMRRELGAAVDVSGFRHVAEYEVEKGRVAMYLEAMGRQIIRIPDLDFEVTLEDGERIHTESSFKYSFEEIDAAAETAGLRVAERWLDSGERFSLNRLVPAS